MKTGFNDAYGNAYFSVMQGASCFMVKIIEATLSIDWQKVISYTPGTHNIFPDYSALIRNAYVIVSRFYPPSNTGSQFTDDLDYLIFRIDVAFPSIISVHNIVHGVTANELISSIAPIESDNAIVLQDYNMNT